MGQILGYNKPRRFPIGHIPPRKKGKVLSEGDVALLLRGRVVVEEKMDGRPTHIETDRFVFLAEDLRRQHSIHYRLPGRFAVFDIYDVVREVFLSPDERTDIVLALRRGVLTIEGVDCSLFFPVPRVAEGVFSMVQLPDLITTSAYAINSDSRAGVQMEGIVVKPARELLPPEQIAGKIVRAEFLQEIVINYLSLPPRYNEINLSVPVRILGQTP